MILVDVLSRAVAWFADFLSILPPSIFAFLEWALLLFVICAVYSGFHYWLKG